MTAHFSFHAPHYWERQLCVVPIEPGDKRPAKEIKGWQGYCNEPPGPELQKAWLDRYGENGIGLLLGTSLGSGARLVAVDVDDDDFVAVAGAVLGECPSAKSGQRGLTFFARTPPDEDLKSTSLKDASKAGKIDVLAKGKMTVLPPSLHPEADKPYEWAGRPLLECNFEELPILDQRKLDLLKLVVSSEHSETLIAGETTHDAGVRLTAQLVGLGSGDAEIEAIIRALLPIGYDGNSLSELSGWIRSARDKGFGAVGRLPLDDEIAHVIAEQLGPLVFIPGEGFRQYRDGYWPSLSDSDIERHAKQLLTGRLKPKQQVRSYLSNVVHCLELNVERSEFGSAARRIGLSDGVINIETGQFEPHSPDHELRFRLDFAYDREARCPTYQDQLARTFANNQLAMNLFDEFAGLTLVPDTRFHKALYLLGAAGCGKSTLLRVVESMHDPEAVSVTSLDKIDDERYLTDLATKLVCISYDVQTKRSVFGEAFVRITGGDPVAIRKLYHEVEGRIVPTVRFIGSMNYDIPTAIAASDALRRRLIFLPCGDRIDTPDPDRYERLAAERPGIFVRWVASLRSLYARGRFEIPEESLDEVVDYTTTEDPVELFVTEKLVADRNSQMLISEVTQEYNFWADQCGEKRLTSNILGRRLRAAGIKGGFANRESGGVRCSCRVIFARLADRRPAY
jgi:P4 family phage/plasmid primase-like protien